MEIVRVALLFFSLSMLSALAVGRFGYLVVLAYEGNPRTWAYFFVALGCLVTGLYLVDKAERK